MSARDVPEAVLPLADTGAPVALITGLPGAGKSLLALSEFAVGKGQVYQYGIPGCALPECAPDKWMTLPKGSTLIVDEAWKYFPPKNPNADPPEHYLIGEIRHTGIALVLISQHPNDIDARIRRRVGRHIHVVRVFGAEEAVLHQKNEVFDVESRTDTITKRWPYPKKVYALYKSADMHRAKEHKPLRLKLLPVMWAGVPLLMIGAAFWMWKVMSPSKPDAPKGAAFVQVANRTPAKPAGPAPAPSYLEQRQARVAGLAYTAPVYDSITAPKDAPYPAACIESKSKGCTCFSQQGTLLDTPSDLCSSIVRRGFFLDWKEPTPQAAGPRVVEASAPASAAPTPWVAPPAPPEPERVVESVLKPKGG